MKEKKTLHADVLTIETLNQPCMRIWERHQRLIHQEKVPPCLLLNGCDPQNQNNLALQLAASLLCEQHQFCTQCFSCQSFILQQHPDFMLIHESDNKSGSYSVDAVNQIQEFLSYQASHNFRVLVIFHIEKLTRQAANRMLKTLEESDPSVRIIMTTSQKQTLLPTLLSRCIVWHVPSMNRHELNEEVFENHEGLYLTRQLLSCDLDHEKIQIAEQIHKLSNFSAKDLVRALELGQNYLLKNKAQLDYKKTVRRRQILSHIKRAVLHDKIHLNKRLIAEAIALS